jgi:death-on-curing family protein
MSRKRISVKDLAREAGLDIDETLLSLWEAGFDDIAGPGDLLARGSANRARRALGLATRRELASAVYWQKQLQLAPDAFEQLLTELGILHPYTGGQLTKKAIHRLTAQLRSRGHAPQVQQQQIPQVLPDVQYTPFSWTVIGHERICRYLTVEEVRKVHFALVDDFKSTPDPIEPAGVRSDSLLASAVHRPLTATDGVLKYPTVEMAAAALLHGIVHDHPFHNGNKRSGLVSMLVFLDENGLVLTCDEDRLFKLVLQLAQHALVSGPRSELPDRETLAVANWLRQHSRLVEKGDRPLPWRRLKKILSAYGCRFEFPPGVGNRINVTRQVPGRIDFLGRRRTRLLRTQTFYGDEGREVDKNTINKIRHDLNLDDEHGIDSRAFYDQGSAPVSEFIVRYRKTLRRLARL